MKPDHDLKKRIQLGDPVALRGFLASALEDAKERLTIYSKDNRDYDLVLKGRALVLKEIIDLLSN